MTRIRTRLAAMIVCATVLGTLGAVAAPTAASADCLLTSPVDGHCLLGIEPSEPGDHTFCGTIHGNGPICIN